MMCDNCGSKLIKIDRRTEIAVLDVDATDGQMADYFAAEQCGDYGGWGIGIVEYRCPKCDSWFQLITDALKSYDPLIVSWHEKAKEGDYFSRFVFEYLAFVALLQNKLFIGVGSDRKAIQALKRDTTRKKSYLAAVAQHERLGNLWRDVIAELEKTPLHNSSRDLDYPEIDAWWNCVEARPAQGDDAPKGVIRSSSDWVNMVEFWCGVRNNLFHGGKDPNFRRDCFLVEHAYRTLAEFMENEISHM